MKLHPQIQLVNNTYWKIVTRNFTKYDIPIAKRGQVLVDVSTDLLTNTKVAASLKKVVPGLKLIVM